MTFLISVSVTTEPDGMGRIQATARPEALDIVSIRYGLDEDTAVKKALAAALEDVAKYVREHIKEPHVLRS